MGEGFRDQGGGVGKDSHSPRTAAGSRFGSANHKAKFTNEDKENSPAFVASWMSTIYLHLDKTEWALCQRPPALLVLKEKINVFWLWFCFSLEF